MPRGAAADALRGRPGLAVLVAYPPGRVDLLTSAPGDDPRDVRAVTVGILEVLQPNRRARRTARRLAGLIEILVDTEIGVLDRLLDLQVAAREVLVIALDPRIEHRPDDVLPACRERRLGGVGLHRPDRLRQEPLDFLVVPDLVDRSGAMLAQRPGATAAELSDLLVV